MKFSMLQAAKEIGVSQSTMHRYIKSGKVSAARLDSGGYEIDPSELFRAFPPGWKKKGETGSETPSRDESEPHETGGETSGETGVLRAEVKMLREMLERADLDADRDRRAAAETIDDLRKRLDREGEERRSLNLRLLQYQTPPTPPVDPTAPPASPSPGSGDRSRGGFMGFFKRAG